MMKSRQTKTKNRVQEGKEKEEKPYKECHRRSKGDIWMIGHWEDQRSRWWEQQMRLDWNWNWCADNLLPYQPVQVKGTAEQVKNIQSIHSAEGQRQHLDRIRNESSSQGGSERSEAGVGDRQLICSRGGINNEGRLRVDQSGDALQQQVNKWSKKQNRRRKTRRRDKQAGPEQRGCSLLMWSPVRDKTCGRQ